MQSTSIIFFFSKEELNKYISNFISISRDGNCFMLQTQDSELAGTCSYSRIPSGGNWLGFSVRLELLCGRDRIKSWLESLGFSCSHWAKGLLLLSGVWLRLEQHAVINEPQTLPLQGGSAFALKDLPVQSPVTNTPCIWGRENICSNLMFQHFIKVPGLVSVSMQTKRKYI